MSYQWILCGDNTLSDIFEQPLSHFGTFITFAEWKKAVGEDNSEAFKNSMMVINCMESQKNDIEQLCNKMQLFLDNNRPILLIHPTSEDKSALANHGILSSYIQEDSVALFIEPHRDAKGTLRIALAEHFGVNNSCEIQRDHVTKDQEGNILFAKQDNYHVSFEQGLNFQDVMPFIDRIRNTMHFLSTHDCMPVTYVQPNDPPSDVPGTLWINTPINLYYTKLVGGGKVESFTPPIGSITVEGLISIGIYYDNIKYSSAIQWVYLENSGHVATNMGENLSEKRGWSIGDFQIDGGNISSPTLVSNASSPNSVSGQIQYTSNCSLKAGLTAGTEGISANILYDIGSSETESLNKWGIIQVDPNSWHFQQQSPYNGASESGFPDGAADYNGVKSLPDISRSTLAFNTQSTWIHNPAGKAPAMTVNYIYKMKNYFIWCDSYSSSSWHAYSWRVSTEEFKTLVIDFSKAYPTQN